MNVNESTARTPRDGRTYALVHEREDWAEILNAFGELDLSVAKELQSAIDEQLGGSRPVAIDFTFCEYLDSTILSVLVHSVRLWGWRVAIIVPATARIHRIFQMTRLDDALAIFGNREEARLRLVPSA
jgi:anti-anti-sigma factor